MKITLKHRINALLNPDWIWLTGKYNKSFDKWLLASINDHLPFYNITEATAHINGQKLWIANDPYFSFRLITGNNKLDSFRASRTTILLAKEWLDYCMFEEMLYKSNEK